MIFRSDDPGRDFDLWDAYQTRQLRACPRCTKCGEYIQSDIDIQVDEPICEECAG